ncbi:MAG: undecaprenyl-diphosphate phosphatase, partial [Clostridia bacterium]|nr:undecaprenyl-diphosphate phosphatase [Clostridia bacterium]
MIFLGGERDILTNIQALILGLVQGLCEFLPISSTGHLQIAQSWMGLEANTPEMMFFDTILHAATLVAVIGMLLPEILKIFGNLGKSVIRPKTLGASFRQGGGNRMLMALVVGTIPALVAAYFLRDFLENLLPGKWLGLGFLITA